MLDETPDPVTSEGVRVALRDKVRLGLLWSMFQNWGIRFSSLLLFMALARLLTAEQLGLFAAASVVLNFFGLLSEQGLGEAVVQREKVTAEQLNALFWINMGFSILVALVVWLSAPTIAANMNIPELSRVLQVSSLVLPITAATFAQMAMQRRAFGYRWIATTSLVSTILSSVVALVLVVAGFGVWSLVAQTLVASVLVVVLMWLRPAWHLTRQTDFRGLRPLFAYSSHRLGAYLLDFANSRYIEIFLAATLGPAVLAVYTVGLKLHQALMQMLSSSILDVAHSGFSRLAHDRPALLKAYYESVALTATLAVPIFSMVAAVAPSLTLVLFGAKWDGSAEVMRWMGVLGAVQVLQFYNGTSFNAIGRPGIALQIVVARVILTVGALILVRHGGMTSLLYAYLISQMAMTPLSFYLVRRVMGVSLRELLRRIWPMLGGSLLLIATVYEAQSVLLRLDVPPILTLVACVAAGAIVYIGFLLLAAPTVIGTAVSLIRPRPQPVASEVLPEKSIVK